MLTPLIWKTLGSFFALFLASMLLGNVLLLYLSLLPFLATILTLFFDVPDEIKIDRKEKRVSTWVGENVEMSATIEAEKGLGILTIEDPIPEHFELVEGSNFRVFWKGLGRLHEPLNYKIKCTRRGVYRLGPINYESRHFSSFKQTEINKHPTETELIVKVKSLNIKRMRDPKIFSRIPMPLGAVSKLGSLTADFKELREYSPGDPYKQINWKATARLRSHVHPLPIVNDFEREGKKVVLIFLDGSPYMRIGTTVENAFEYAVQAVLGLTQFYLARNCHVGLCVYNHDGKLLLPDSGRKQEYRISKEILSLEPAGAQDKKSELEGASESLAKSVKKCQGYIRGANPYFIIVTMIREENILELIDCIKELQKISRGERKQPQILIIHVMGYSITAETPYENLGAVLLEMRNQPILKLVRGAGAFVIPWNPRSQDFAKLMISGLRRK